MGGDVDVDDDGDVDDDDDDDGDDDDGDDGDGDGEGDGDEDGDGRLIRSVRHGHLRSTVGSCCIRSMKVFTSSSCSSFWSCRYTSLCRSTISWKSTWCTSSICYT